MGKIFPSNGFDSPSSLGFRRRHEYFGDEDCFDCKQNSIQRFTHVFPLFVAPKQQKCFVTEMCSPLTIYDSCNAEGAEEMSGDKSLVWL